ncbi:MAG: hypothetical protein M3220_01550 [Chloroflexota bacterium]|nr:hypothetical protein [Chloroflexota bacterium]
MRQKDEWMYPHAVTGQLGEARGEAWQELTEHIATLDEEHLDSLAFQLVMVRLCGCATCQPGSYRLSLGCATCAFRTVSNLKTSDGQLIRRYHTARDEVQAFLTSREKAS